MHDFSRNPSVGKQAVSMGSLIRSVTNSYFSPLPNQGLGNPGS